MCDESRKHGSEGGTAWRHAVPTRPYTREELVAEMGAAFLCAEAGIEDPTIDNSAAYIAGWLSFLRSGATR